VKTKRREARILAMQALFQLDAQSEDFFGQLDDFLRESSESREVVDYADRLARGTWAHRARIDLLIGQASEHWSIDRMPPVDRSILRLAVHELIELGDPPAAVVIDEAIELGKVYGDADTPQFINGVLDAVRKTLEQGVVAPSD
jgi:transcription antitermination protein NusB